MPSPPDNQHPDKQHPDNHTTIRFLLDGQLHEVQDISPTTTVLNYVRERLRRTGTKEGCAEGDCGACTVVLAELATVGLRFRAINSCIQFVPTLDGKALFTVESLKKINDGRLHPVQQALVECHASQCGFCTPGFVMSLFALYKNTEQASRSEIDDGLSGNLCRCTGYRPIIEAAQRMYELGRDTLNEQTLADKLEKIKPAACLRLKKQNSYYAPVAVAELAELFMQYPDATILAGGTDIGLWVNKQFRELPITIYIGYVAELHYIDKGHAATEIGAAVSLSDAFAVLEKDHPDLRELGRRFASPPIRNAGTLCGNIANGSPIGDSMPALISLGATLLLRCGDLVRELPLDKFYLAYQKNALRPGEFVQAVRIPCPPTKRYFRAYKNAKRYDQDISAVCAAYNIQIEDGTAARVRICYGGMAAIPQRAFHTEQQIQGKPWSQATVKSALAALAEDYEPLTDMRASAEYRLQVAANLLMRFYWETVGETIGETTGKHTLNINAFRYADA